MFFRSKKDAVGEPADAAAPPPASSGNLSVPSPAAAPSAPTLAAGDGTERAGAAPTGANDAARAFARIVTVLMRTAETRVMTLADLEWLVLPAIRHQQMAVADAKGKDGKPGGPVGVVLWANVSAEVDARLAQDRAPVAKLAPHEWASGNITWIVLSIGRPEVVGAMLGELRKGRLAGRIVKVRSVGPNGPAVEVFNFTQ